MAQDSFDPNTELRKRWALMQMQAGGDASPVKHPLQAVARALQGAMGGYMAGQAEQSDSDAFMKAISSHPAMQAGGDPAATPSSPQSTSTPATPRGEMPTLISDTAQKYGIDPNYAIRTASLESGMNPSAANPNSSAAGLFQFTKGTWGQYGNGGSPNDPQANTDAAMRLAKDNAGVFQQRFGRAPTNGELYLMHQQGAGGASALLSNPSANVVDALAPAYGGDRAKAAAAVINNGGSPEQTAGDFAGRWTNKFQTADNSPLPQGAQPVQYKGAPQTNGTPQRTVPALAPAVREYILQAGKGGPATRALALKALEMYGAPKDQWVQQRNADGSIYQRNMTTGEMRAVEKSDVLPPEAVRQKVEIAAAGKPVTTIDQRAPDEFEKEYGAGMGKRALEVISQGDAATQDLQQSALSRSFLSKVKTGALAPAQATVGAWAKAIGIDPAKLGIDPNLPAVSQVAQSAMAQQTVSMIGSGGFPANNFSDADRKFLTSIPANLSNLPEANELLADIRERVAQRKIERANAWADAREQKISYEKFESQWRKKVASEDLFADVRGKVGALEGGGWQDIGGVQIRKKQ